VHKISKKEKINSTVTTKVDIPKPEKRFWVRWWVHIATSNVKILLPSCQY